MSTFQNCFNIDEHCFLQLIFKRKNQEGVRWQQPQFLSCHGAGECCLLQRQMEVCLHQERDPQLPFQVFHGKYISLRIPPSYSFVKIVVFAPISSALPNVVRSLSCVLEVVLLSWARLNAVGLPHCLND